MATTAPVIVTAHKDTSAEDEAMEAVEESGADETSNVEVISVVSSPSLLVGQGASESIKESGDASNVEARDQEEEDSDLIFKLVKMEVDAENQEPPPSQELYSDKFEEEDMEDEEELTEVRSDNDRLSTIPEDEESRDVIQCCHELHDKFYIEICKSRL